MKATGVNANTKAQLKKLVIEGYNAGEISDIIQVEEVSVKAWMNYFADLIPSKNKIAAKKKNEEGKGKGKKGFFDKD